MWLSGSKRWFAAGILCSCLVSLLDLTGPRVISYTVDSIIGDAAPSVTGPILILMNRLGGAAYLKGHLAVLAAVIALLALAAGVCRYLNGFLNTIGGEKLVKRMRDQLFCHIDHLPASWFTANHTGDIIQRCTSDVETIRSFISEQLTSLLRIVILMVSALVFMAGISLPLTGVSAIFFPVIVGYSLFFHGKIGDAFGHADEEEGKLSSITQENLTGVRVVRAFGREAYERERFETQNAGYTKMWIRLMGLMSAFWSSSDLISGLQVLSVTVTGAILCVQGHLTAGQYISFISYNAMLTWPVRQLGRVIAGMSRAGISIDRLRSIMNAEPEEETIPVSGQTHREKAIPKAAQAQDADDTAGTSFLTLAAHTNASREVPSSFVPGDIVFDCVSFRYGTGSAQVLQDISFTIREGTTVGILGGTGSGKSTLAALLVRLWELEPGCGSIRIAGTDIRRIPLPLLRRNVGIVLQEPYLFSMSLGDNIAAGDLYDDQDTDQDEDAQEAKDLAEKEAARLERIKEAASAADLDETAEHFTEGYDTFVGERGVTLSGGQKQRTAIAQMLIRKPPVLVFDDSLSAVDAETDAKIRHALGSYVHGSTVILISHRITTLMQADKIIVMDTGRIAESGTHEELLAQGGIYRKIYDLQVRQSDL